MSSYVFRSEWRLSAPPERVYELLADVETYPQWWPQVRSARRIDDGAGELTCRSLLPYDVTFRMRRVVEDPVSRVLRAELAGDLNGTSQWTIDGDAGETVAVFDEDVSVGSGKLRLASKVMRPALRFNHDLMMRAGERGLREFLRRGARSGA